MATYDVTGNTMTGTLPYDTNSKFGTKAVNFTSTSAFASNIGLDFSSGGAYHTYSVSVWVRFNGIPTHSVHKLLNNGNTSVGYVFSIRDDGSTRAIYGGGTYDNYTAMDFPAYNNTDYFHCVVTYDGTSNTVSTYVNNSFSRSYTADGSLLPTNAQLKFGRSTYGVFHKSNCKVDQMRIYSRVLTTAEINDLYNEV